MLSPARRAGVMLAALAAAGAVVSGQSQAPVRDQAAPTRSGIVTVGSVDGLAAVTPEEKELAVFFSGGFEVLGPKPPMFLNGAEVSIVASSDHPVVAPRRNFRDVRRDYMCLYDAVVVGTPVSRRVILNDGGRGMVSVFEIAVSNWITSASDAHTVVAGAYGGQAFVKDFLYESGTGPDVWMNGPSIFVLRQPEGLSLTYKLDVSSPVVDGRTSLAGLDGSLESVIDELRTVALTCGEPVPTIQLQMPEGR